MFSNRLSNWHRIRDLKYLWPILLVNNLFLTETEKSWSVSKEKNFLG